jgi:adenosine deaminase
MLRAGVELNELNDFFGLFGAIYALTSTPASIALVTRVVLDSFLGGGESVRQCTYLELRSTPRETEHMTRLVYLETVLDEIEKYSANQANLIVSIDRRMSKETANEIVDIVMKLKEQGRRVVGVDLCGDPLVRVVLHVLP